MKYKLSKYNFVISNDKEELLLYNTYMGTQSLIKLLDKNKEQFFKCMYKQNEIENMPDRLLKTLIYYGYLVPEEEDEAAKLNEIYINKIGSTDLELTILPTMQCNFRCKYCYESFEDALMSKEVQQSLIQFVSRNISKYSGLNVS